MRRTLIVVSTCIILSYIVAFTSFSFLYSLFAGRGANDKIDFILMTTVGIFLVLPAASVLVGIIVGLLEQDDRWWLSGVSMAPLLLYLIFEMAAGPVVILCIIYEVISLATGYGFMKLRRKYRVLRQV